MNADQTQVSIVSTATTQSALLNHEVYLTEYLPRASRDHSIKLTSQKPTGQSKEREDAPPTLSLLCTTLTRVHTELDRGAPGAQVRRIQHMYVHCIVAGSYGELTTTRL
jgi:hypothetical protein